MTDTTFCPASPHNKNELAFMTKPAARRLIACLHDVSPRDFDRIVEIDRFYDEIGIGSNYAMLVVPDFWGAWSLEDYPDFIAWLKQRAADGVEMFLHGFFHHDTTPKDERSAWRKFCYQALGEGEFANIEEYEALKRLSVGRKMLENMLDVKITSFVAPAWQYSAGARAALKELGFSVAENRSCVWSPAQNRVLSKTPVIAYSNRSAARRHASIFWSKLSATVLKDAQIVRHAIHPDDFNDEALKNEITRSLRELLSRREVITYRRLLDTPSRAR